MRLDTAAVERGCRSSEIDDSSDISAEPSSSGSARPRGPDGPLIVACTQEAPLLRKKPERRAGAIDIRQYPRDRRLVQGGAASGPENGGAARGRRGAGAGYSLCDACRATA